VARVLEEYDDPDGEPCRIREAHPEDMAAVASIYNQYLGRSTFDLVPKDADQFAELMRRFEADGRQELLVTECGGEVPEVIGWGLIKRYSDREAYAGACETSVFFDEAHLRQGHGSRLKRLVLEECRRLGYHHVVAKIVADNVAAIRYNERQGYEIVGVQRGIGLVEGRRIDVCILQRLL